MKSDANGILQQRTIREPSRRTIRISCRGRLQDLHAARNQDGGPGQLHPFDTYHGLDWDGPGPVPRVYGLKAEALAYSGRGRVVLPATGGLRPRTHAKGD